MKSSLRKLRGFALQRHEQRVDRHRDHSTAAKAADELLAAAQVRASLAPPFPFRRPAAWERERRLRVDGAGEDLASAGAAARLVLLRGARPRAPQPVYRVWVSGAVASRCACPSRRGWGAMARLPPVPCELPRDFCFVVGYDGIPAFGSVLHCSGNGRGRLTSRWLNRSERRARCCFLV
uniref:Predicted protein n=1 Tax=Hordeum vulgare subsp. vulgare TaxID=112509 RepID=F2EIL9_HORVV|nr:predicted protein [Hordeum vulgare subsp. vulgare]